MKRFSVSAIVFPAIVAALLVIGGATALAAVDIAGHWRGSNGVEYDITQIGNTFNWKVPATGEIGVGTINGMDCSAGWPFGFATGHIIADPAGNTVEIDWNNGVFFQRGGPPGGTPGAMPPGPGPTPPPPPTPPTPPGGGSSELTFSFGPNPAWPGAEVWVNLSLPVAHKIQIWHNGAVLPITSFMGNNTVKVKLPMKVTSGTFKVEYQGKHYVSTQARSDLEIKPLDIGGNWIYKGYGPGMASGPGKTTITQNGDTLTVAEESTWSPPVTTMMTGRIYDGNKIKMWEKSGPGVIYGVITEVDENGRVQKFEMDFGSGSKDVYTHP